MYYWNTYKSTASAYERVRALYGPIGVQQYARDLFNNNLLRSDDLFNVIIDCPLPDKCDFLYLGPTNRLLKIIYIRFRSLPRTSPMLNLVPHTLKSVLDTRITTVPHSQMTKFFLAIFRNEITTILTPSTSVEGE